MIGIIEENHEVLADLCVRYHVKRFEIFGSALEGDNFDREKSDLDFLVEFLPLEPGQHARAYFDMLEALQDLFKRHIDLVEIKAVKNPYFLKSINETRRELYAT